MLERLVASWASARSSRARVTQRGDTLSISAELIDARDNSHIWGQQYDRKLADMDRSPGRDRKGDGERAARAFNGRRREAPDQDLHRESRSLSGLSERPLLVEQEHRGGIRQGHRILSAGNRKGSQLRAGLFRLGRLLQLACE